jgi:anti-sigma regulatory factor (Ser/Thr protein kinase)
LVREVISRRMLVVSTVAEARELARIRRAIRRYLEDHHVVGELATKVLVAVNEACTDAVRRRADARAALEVHASLDDEALVVIVRDNIAVLSTNGAGNADTIGMELMRRLSDEVAVTPRDGAVGTERTLRFRHASG